MSQCSSFGQFLRSSFGNTLYELYFKPYNEKIWDHDLDEIPLSWLEGKLPMPKVVDIIKSNISRASESNMVHSSFYYPVRGGSQFIVERLSKGLTFTTSSNVSAIERASDGTWLIDGASYSHIIYTGDVRKVFDQITFPSSDQLAILKKEASSKSHSTSNVLCECDSNPYS